MLVGFHVEGHDHLVLGALVAQLTGIDEHQLVADVVELPGQGWQQVLDEVPRALKRFYAKGASFAIVGVDNDGDTDLLGSGASEDPAHPRHWNHPNVADPKCRQCRLDELVTATRRQLTWNSSVLGTWPIVIAVPVEMLEAWLLVMQAVVDPGKGSLHAERERRSGQKVRLYGRPGAARADVEAVALPLVRSTTAAQLSLVSTYSKSFEFFAAQIARLPVTRTVPPA